MRSTGSAVNPANSYKVYRNNRMIAQGIVATTYTDNNLVPGTYNYEVTTVYNGLESPRSIAVSATITAPLNVTVTASDPIYVPNPVPGGWTGISLTANATGGNGSYTYSWTPANAVNNPTAQTTTASPNETTTYTCTVTSNGQSVSGSVTVIVVIPPTDVTAELISENEVSISWNAAEYADSYNVYREGAGGNFTLIAENVSQSPYIDHYEGAGSVAYCVRSVYQGFISQPEITGVYFCVAPENVQAEYIWNDGDFYTHIAWTKNQAVNYQIERFNVYRSIDNSNFEMVGEVVSEDYVYEYSFDDVEATTIGSYVYYITATYNVGCETQSELVSCMVTAVGESAVRTELYPNPTTGKVTVKAEELEQVVIINSLGQILYQTDTDTTETCIDLAPYGKGLYLILIRTKHGVATQRIIVE